MPFGALNLNLGVGMTSRVAVSVTFEAEATALFARMSSPPSDARKLLINSLIASLKSAGVWSKLYLLHVIAAADSQAAYLNWISTSYPLTETGVLNTFTADRGWTGDGLTGYLDSGWAPNLGQQDSAHLGVWSLNSAQMLTSPVGLGTTSGYSIIPRNTSDNTTARANSTGNTTAAAQTDGSGFFAVNRSASNAVQIYRNGVSIGTGSNVSAAPSAVTLNVGRVNNAPIASQVAAVTAGTNLNSTEQAALYAALLAYMQGVGAG